MKKSRYTIEVEINKKISMLYNTLSRQYYVFLREERKQIFNLLSEINCGEYTRTEILIIRELLRKKIIIKDNTDELLEVKYLENKIRFQDSIFYLTIYMTNACNFQCVYCTQNHVVKNLTNETLENIIDLICEISTYAKQIYIKWFGGEPLLQYSKMLTISQQAYDICKADKCKLNTFITTNGYLLSRSNLIQMKKYGLSGMQVTVDIDRTTHNKMRPLANGKGTYDIIIKNILTALEMHIKIVLRINIPEGKTLDSIMVLNEIPIEYRKFVVVSFCNVFQNEKKESMYKYIKKAIDMGFQYESRNNFNICDAGRKHSLYIDTDGSVLMCSNTCQGEKKLGILKNRGYVTCDNVDMLYKIKTVSALDNKSCRECVELPYCIGSCPYGMLQCEDKCLGEKNDGLTLKERALLDYYCDRKKGEIK